MATDAAIAPGAIVSMADGSLRVELANAPVLDTTFYANTVMFRRRGPVFTLVFGQTALTSEDEIQVAVGVDMPAAAVVGIASTFVPSFRATVEASAKQLGAMIQFPEGKVVHGPCVLAHLARAATVVDVGVLDFYAIAPGPIGAPATVEPVLRVEANSPLIQFFIEKLTAAARTISEGG